MYEYLYFVLGRLCYDEKPLTIVSRLYCERVSCVQVKLNGL